MKYEKTLPRTEYGLVQFFEGNIADGIDSQPKRAYAAGLKLKQNGWTKSWYYQTVVKPWMQKNKPMEVSNESKS